MKTSRANATHTFKTRNNNGSRLMRKALMLAFAVFSLLMMSTIASAQLSGTKNIPGDYATLAAAITDLNTQGVGAGGVTLNLLAANPQTAPAGGYVLGGAGSMVLTTSSSSNPVTIQGNANTITASAALTVGALNDAIFKLIGADWITITGFTMLENPANTVTTAASNNMTEWGVALLYVTTTDGAQNDTIQNNTIDLDRTYQNTFGIYSNSTHSATAVTTSATATGAAGGNDNLKIYTNNITDVNIGIVHVGPTAAADQNPTADIGGVALATGNTITNFGTTATFSSYANVSGTVNGILVRNTRNFNVSFNTVTSSNGGVTVGTLNGIQIPASSVAPTGTLTQTINNNTISLRSAVAAGAIVGITMPSTSVNSTTTNNINNNDFNTFGHTVAATGTITFISQAGNPLTQTFNNNTFTNISVNTTGTITFFSFAPSLIATASMSLSSNSIVTGFTRTGVGTTTVYSTNASSVAGSTEVNSNNNFSNITLTGASAFNGILNTDGGAPVKTINGNTFSNITTGAGTVVPMSVNFSGPGTNVNNNTITGITTGNSITALLIGSSNAATITVSGNIIDPITSGGAVVTGISTAAPTAVISKNKIYDLSGTIATSVVSGILVTNTTASSAVTLSNNLVGNLTAPAATGANAAIGINITGSATTSTYNVFFNTVYVNNTTSGAGFGSSGISALASATGTTSTLNLRNNIIVNTSVQNGAGLTVAYRRSLGTAGTLANYASTSNNNDFYAGAPSATNLIYSDGTSTAQTLAAYKAGVFTAGTITPRDSASVTELPPFLSTTGSSVDFLHINPAIATQVESGGGAGTGILDDFDGQVRNVSTPDIGADEFSGILLDLIGPTISYTPLLNTSSTGDRVLNISVVDASGVPTAGIGLPVIYYRKNAGSYVSTQCAFVSGSNYTCGLLSASLGGVALTDVIDYYVAAQDNAGNVSVNPSTGAGGLTANPPAASTPPTTPNTYKIVGSVSGSFNVGTAETYTSLTNASGIFDFINQNEVTGNITLNITTDLSGETGSIALNAYAPAFTILIRPSGAARTITSTAAATVLIKLNGASNVTIDGSLSGGTDRSLSIVSIGTVTPSAVVFGSLGTTPITNDTLKNCVVVNGLNTSSAVVISDAGTLGNPGFFSNITIQNNDIQKAFIGVYATGGTSPQNGSNLTYTQNTVNTTGANAVRSVGLYMQGVNGATVSLNTIGNIDKTNDENDVGIWLASGTINATVSGNTVATLGYTGTSGFAPIGINVTSALTATNNNVTGNSVSDISTNGTTTVRGIAVTGTAADLTIQKNNVQGIFNSNTGTFGVYGIDISAGNNVVVKNNFVSNVNHDMTGGAAFSTTFGVFGIRVGSGTGIQVYNNSVNLYGLMPGAANTSLLSAAFGLVSTTSTGCDVRNNIFANNITGGTTSVAAVSAYLPSGGTSAMNLTWNNNAYYFGTDAARQGVGQAGTTAGTNFFTTLAALAAYSSTLSVAATNDNASLASTGAVPYLTNNDLHITPSAGAILGGGAAIGSVTNDYDMDPRPASMPDIGADELVKAVLGVIPGGTYYNAFGGGGASLGGNVTITNTFWLTGTPDTGANTLTIDCNGVVFGAGAGSYVLGNLARNYCGTGGKAFDVGTANGYSPVNVNATAGTFAATFTIKAVQGPQPSVNAATSIQRYWTLTNAGLTSADLTFQYLVGDVMGTESNYKLIRVSGGAPVAFPTSVVTPATHVATLAGATSFSDWTVGETSAPTAAPASISGQVTTTSGAPLAGVTMYLSGARSARTITDSNGNYRFTNVATDNFYTVSPSIVNYHFSPASRSFSLLANMTDAVFTGTLNSVISGNVIDTPEYFVRQHYLDFLGREPDDAGFNFWSDQIIGCGNDFNCIERRTINVSAAYFLSIEFQETGGLVDGLYRASYGRAPLFAEFMPDTGTVAHNVIVGNSGWERQLATNKQEFLDAWVQRPAFRAAYDNLTNDGYVDTLISHTGVNFTDSERAALVGGLTDGTLTRAQVLQRVAENERFVRAKFNETFVRMEYFGYLRRDPDDSGFHFWLDKLNEFDGNFERAEMVKAFLVSSEYRARFSQ